MDFAEVYVYIGKEHKINSEYKKCSFTSISSQEWGSLYTWQKYQRPVWSHHRLFTLRNKSTRFSLFPPPFWIAACWSFDDEMLQSVQSLMLWISQLLPLVFFLLPVLLSQVRLSSLKFSISPRVDVQLFVSGWALGQQFLYGTTSLGIKWEERGEKGNGEQYAGLVNSKCVLSQPHPILLPHTHTVTGS